MFCFPYRWWRHSTQSLSQWNAKIISGRNRGRLEFLAKLDHNWLSTNLVFDWYIIKELIWFYWMENRFYYILDIFPYYYQYSDDLIFSRLTDIWHTYFIPLFLRSLTIISNFTKKLDELKHSESPWYCRWKLFANLKLYLFTILISDSFYEPPPYLYWSMKFPN